MSTMDVDALVEQLTAAEADRVRWEAAARRGAQALCELQDGIGALAAALAPASQPAGKEEQP
jgi:hypothetical protein